MKSVAALLLVAVSLFAAFAPGFAAEQRFPPPEFSQGHVMPETATPGPDLRTSGWLDITVLAAALLLASWITLRLRSRAAIVVLGVLCLAWFGFWRRGCVCAIGSVQNVALGLADPGYAVPLATVAFFVLPLLTALVAGRSFCSGVCPHGALQELVLVKPVRVPAWLDEPLRFLPWIYLGLAVLLAATGGLFLICQYDPFVGFFRMSGSRGMLVAGASLLVLSLFVGRPYCRYLCPYGALLGLASRVSKWRPTVAPDRCTQCRLCRDSCPYDALNVPTPGSSGGAIHSRESSRRRILVLIALIPLAIVFFGWAGGRVGLLMLDRHPEAVQAGMVRAHVEGKTPPGAAVPDEVTAFLQTGGSPAELFARAGLLESRHLRLGQAIGGVLGLLLALKFAGILFPARSSDYRTDASRCVSCTRCFSACPYELVRRGVPVALPDREGGRDE